MATASTPPPNDARKHSTLVLVHSLAGDGAKRSAYILAAAPRTIDHDAALAPVYDVGEYREHVTRLEIQVV